MTEARIKESRNWRDSTLQEVKTVGRDPPMAGQGRWVVSPERTPSTQSEAQLNLKQKYSVDLLGISEDGVCASEVAEHR